MQSPMDPIEEQPTRYYRRRQTLPAAPEGKLSAPPPIYFSPPEAPRRSFPWRRLLLGLLLTLAVLVAGGLVAGGTYLYTSDAIAPGTEVLGIDVGGRSTAAAERALTAAWNQRAVALTYDNETWLLHPEELGVTLDVPATVDAAYAASRTVTSWREWLRSGTIAVYPVWRLDPAQAERALHDLASQLVIAPQDATLVVADGRVQTTPAREGRQLDIAATRDFFVANGAVVVLDGQLPLQTRSVPPAVTDLSAAAAAATELLQKQIVVSAYDPVRDETFTWMMSPAIWGAWLELASNEPDEAADPLIWDLNTAAAADFFNARSNALGADRYLDVDEAMAQTRAAIAGEKEGVDLRVRHTAVTHTVQSGETLAAIGRTYGIPYPWIQQANPGLPAALAVGQQIIIPSPDELIPYPIVQDKRIVVSISEQRVWVYEAGGLKWEWTTSTGIASSPTAPGVFQVQSHEPEAYAANWDLWMPYFMGIYQPLPTSDFMNGFHGFPTRDGVNLLWTSSLGRPVTYGCILLGNQQAEQLYNWAEQGVIVEIKP